MRLSPRGGCLIAAVMAAGTIVSAADPPTLTVDEVKDFVNKRVTVCGVVASTRQVLSPRQGGKQHFLQFAHKPESPPFSVVIVGNDLAAGGVFYDIERRVAQKQVCVTGYPKPANVGHLMRVDAPTQLKIVDADR